MRRTLIAIVAAVLVVALSSCGTKTVKPKILNTETVERAIEASISQKEHFNSLVSCPPGTEKKKGVVFQCMAYYTDGRTPFRVTVDSDKGAVHYLGLKPIKNKTK